MQEVLAIGNFDGVHLGHRKLLAKARQLADAMSGRVVAMTFDPFPSAILRPEHQPLRLMTTEQRVAALKQAGADEVRLLAPTPDFLALEPTAFFDRLTRESSVAAIVEGENFRFGAARHGDVQLLKQLCAKRGIACHIEPSVEVVLCDLLTAPVSSTLVRWLVSHGRMSDAARCLTQPFSLTGPVVHGEARGRTIGVPTANLDPAAMSGLALPADGVYAGWGHLPDEPLACPAAISLGIKPTYGRHQRVIEAHLLGFCGDLYGQTIRLELTRHLREQRSFPSPAELVAQIHRDLEQVRRLADQKILSPVAFAMPQAVPQTR